MKEREGIPTPENKEQLPGKGRRVYIGGSLDFRYTHEVFEEHEHINNLLLEKGFTPVDPMRNKWEHYLAEETIAKSHYRMQEIINRDLQDLQKCDFHLILTGDKASWGTAIEFGYSVFVTGKPVVLVIRNPELRARKGWHTFLATKVVGSAEEAVDYISGYWAE